MTLQHNIKNLVFVINKSSDKQNHNFLIIIEVTCYNWCTIINNVNGEITGK